MSEYAEFIKRKSQLADGYGFEPVWMPDFLYPFQAVMTEWAIRRGRSAEFADCGLGKTPMQLVFAENVARKTGGRVLILTPLAVSAQTISEGEKFGVEVHRSRDGKPADRITISNYEILHKFDPEDFVGVVCDESSIIKHFAGATQKLVTRFMSKMRYRLLCTATAAPNDYAELGTSSEALGELGYSDMLSRFFKQVDPTHRMEQIKQQRGGGNYFQKLSFRVSQSISGWRLKGHAHEAFWRWVCSWARACRKPSDLGFDDGGFDLPALEVRDHIIAARSPAPGRLFTMPAFGLQEEREERRRTLDERCEMVAQLVDHDRPAVVWCHYNKESERLAKIIPGCVEVKGPDSMEQKEEAYREFGNGGVRVLVTKPKIGAWGLNWQHCAHVVTFASHSYEQYYQSIRRCWRFGQTKPVVVDIVSTEGEQRVMDNMKAKAEAADLMFGELVRHMYNATNLDRSSASATTEVPAWL